MKLSFENTTVPDSTSYLTSMCTHTQTRIYRYLSIFLSNYIYFYYILHTHIHTCNVYVCMCSWMTWRYFWMTTWQSLATHFGHIQAPLKLWYTMFMGVGVTFYIFSHITKIKRRRIFWESLLHCSYAVTDVHNDSWMYIHENYITLPKMTWNTHGTMIRLGWFNWSAIHYVHFCREAHTKCKRMPVRTHNLFGFT